ncbi:MAG: hypothetical protein OEX22_04990 [Cyclobacteriaceae bacterium]|nr:hypothetical protein [Cyclobacteriaceae bacterium]
MKKLTLIILCVLPLVATAQDSLVVVNSTQDSIVLSRQDLLKILRNDSLRTQNSNNEEVEKINYVIPKLTIKISPLHFVSDHPFNLFPSYNIGIEHRLKKESNSLYHEVGVIGHRAGISPEKILSYLTNSEIGTFRNDEVISNIGFRVREQIRSYFFRGEKVFIFLGAEASYFYQDTEVGEWAWINDQFGGYERYIIYNQIRKNIGINPVFGFSYFSKKEESSKSKKRLSADLYFGFGFNFVVKENRNVPSGVSTWFDSGLYIFDDFSGNNTDGRFFTPNITLGFKVGYIISK